jgi:hypothetical protein
MSKKRPGVAAALRLAASSDVSLWARVEGQLDEVLASIKNLSEKNEIYQALGTRLLITRKGGVRKNDSDQQDRLSKQDLLEVIIPWKFAVGKSRPALLKHLTSNSNNHVETHTLAAISKAENIPDNFVENELEEDDNGELNLTQAIHDAIQKAVGELANHIKGVGPATASAILALARPDVFCYMYDEVIDCFLPKRTYTLPVYMTLHSNCLKISKRLGWSPCRVACTLWIAARIQAMGGEDYTAAATTVAKDADEVEEETKRRPKRGTSGQGSSTRTSKRRKRN